MSYTSLYALVPYDLFVCSWSMVTHSFYVLLQFYMTTCVCSLQILPMDNVQLFSTIDQTTLKEIAVRKNLEAVDD